MVIDAPVKLWLCAVPDPVLLTVMVWVCAPLLSVLCVCAPAETIVCLWLPAESMVCLWLPAELVEPVHVFEAVNS